MLRHAKDLKNYKLGARNGEIGKSKDIYFDDQTWTVRYLIVDTGGWLSGRQVLISPYVLDKPDDNNKVIPVSLTKEKIENSPSIDADRPVSRQDEWNYYSYYDWPGYWVGPYAWGPYSLPRREAIGWSEDMRRATGNDPHLRSMKEVTGYTIQGLDDSVGHVEDFIIDDDTMAIRYMIVDTRNWWPGKKVLVSPQWIDRVSWDDSKVFVSQTREAIKAAPEYNEYTPSRAITKRSCIAITTDQLTGQLNLRLPR